MALFQKQDFTPPLLSKRWFTMQFRPNMLLYCHEHIVKILESGLLFREDSIEIEEQVLCWMEPEMTEGVFLTGGEKVMSALAFCATVATFPPRHLNRWTVVRVASYLLVPAALRSLHRRRCTGSVRALLKTMMDYLGVARRAAACCREYAALYAKLASVVSVAESMERMLLQQQTDMVNMLSRVSAAVLGNAPWLKGDVAWEAVCRPGDSLMKVHHTFLVVQSLLLKHIAMVHYMSSSNQKIVYKNYNERVYWIHNVVIPYLIGEYNENYEALDRMYRLLKNCAVIDTEETKKPGFAIRNSWLYSEVHTDIARASLELRVALNKSNSIDKFLDSCAIQNANIEPDALNKDIDDLIDNITKCLSSAQGSQKRLKKIEHKINPIEEKKEEEEIVQEANVVKIDDKVPEAKDEVFYFVKTEDDEAVPQAGDVITGPGRKEKEASEVVLHELKRKLGKREDVMRERERQALMKTMPQYKDNVPEFPRQIQIDEYVDRKGFINKLVKPKPKKKLFRQYKIAHKKPKLFKRGELKTQTNLDIKVKKNELYTANEKLKAKNKLLSVSKMRKTVIVTLYRRNDIKKELDSSGISDDLSDVEASASNKVVTQAVNPNQDKVNANLGKVNADPAKVNANPDKVNANPNKVNANPSKGNANPYKGNAYAVRYRPNPDKVKSKTEKKTKRFDPQTYRFASRDIDLTPSTSDSEEEFRLRTGSLMDDVRRRRAIIRRKYRKKPEGDTEMDESMKPMEYRFGTGMAMASVLQKNHRWRPSMAQEELFLGEGEVSDDSGNSDSE